MLTKETNPNNHPTPLNHPPWKRRALVLSLLLAALFVAFVALSENNEGTPSENPEGEDFKANCGINDDGCHADHKDPNLDIYTTPDSEDNHKFAAPIEKNGEKLSPGDYDVQAKAVAKDGKSSYIDSLDDTDNDGQLDLTSHDPEEDEEFWVGFGYKKDDSIFVYVKDPGYTYHHQGTPPVPRATISLEPDFPDDAGKTIVIEEGDDDKTLPGTLSKDGMLTVYFTGEESFDDDGDELSYYWDIDGDGNYETGEESGDNLNETGMNYQYNYTETGSYRLKFRVADGSFESGSIFFNIEVKETEKKPELFVDDVTVETGDGENALDADIYKGDELEIAAFIRNHDESGYGAPTPGDVRVAIYYALKSDNYDSWYLFDDMPINLGRLNIEGQKKASFTWDTSGSGFPPDEYKVRVVVDEDDDVEEWDEENNAGTYDGIVELQALPPPRYPEISMGDIELNSSRIQVNDVVEVDVTILNTGDGDGEFIFIKLFIDNEYRKTSSSFAVPAGGARKLSDTDNGVFMWSPAEAGNYTLRLELSYFNENGEQTVELELKDVEVHPRIIENPPTNHNGHGDPTPWYQTTTFYGAAVLVCVAAIGTVIFISRRQ